MLQCYKKLNQKFQHASLLRRLLIAASLLGLGGLLGGVLYGWNKPSLERPYAYQGYKEAYRKTLTLRDGSTITLVPATLDQKDFDSLSAIYKDPSCAAKMTNGTPWPDKAIKNNQTFYAYSWELFYDLEKSNLPHQEPLTLSFLIFDEKGQLVGDIGLQAEHGARNDELFFNILPAFRRRGVAYTGSQYLIEFYHQHFGNKPLGANILPHNKPSQGLVKKLGFKPLFNADGSRRTVIMHGRVFELWERSPENK